MTVKRTYRLTDQAAFALESMYEKERNLQGKGGRSRDSIVSEAILQYSASQSLDYGEQLVERLIQDRMKQMETGLRSLLASMGIDIGMLLMHSLAMEKANRGLSDKQLRTHFEKIREDSVAYWNRKRSVKAHEEEAAAAVTDN